MTHTQRLYFSLFALPFFSVMSLLPIKKSDSATDHSQVIHDHFACYPEAKFDIYNSDIHGHLEKVEEVSFSDPACDPPVIDFIWASGTDCHGAATGAIVLDVSGGTPFSAPSGCEYIFDWDWDGTQGVNDDFPNPLCPTNDQQSPNNLYAGTYYLTITDAAGCSVETIIVIDEPSGEAINISSLTNIDLDCYGNTSEVIDIDVSGGFEPYTFEWNWNGSPHSSLEDPNISGPGTYALTVTDFLGCSAVYEVIVTEPAELLASATSDPVLCAGGTSGSIQLDVSGGTPGYTYDWNYNGPGGGDPQNPSGLPAGMYTVTVTDLNGCTAVTTVEVTEPTAPIEVTMTSTDITCHGENDGVITLITTGGTGSYSYAWNNQPADLNYVPPGSYSVTVTDANGCSDEGSVTIAEPDEISSEFTDDFCQGELYVLPDGSTTNSAGQHGPFTFTAANGCDSLVYVNLSQLPQSTTDLTDEFCDGGSYVLPDGTTTSTEGQHGPFIFPAANGCDSLVTVTLTKLPQLTTNLTGEFCEGDTFTLPDGSTTSTPGAFGPFTFVSASGCDSIVNINLTQLPDVTITLDESFCEGEGYVLPDGTTTQTEGQHGPFNFQTSTGCDSIVFVNLTELSVDTTHIYDELCEGAMYILPDGSQASAGGTFGPYVYPSGAGCDSVVILHLDQLDQSETHIVAEFCANETYILPDGSTASGGGSFGPFTFTAANSCDSLVYVELTSHPVPVTNLAAQFCEGTSYILPNGTPTNTPGAYGPYTFVSAAGCDSLVYVNLVEVSVLTEEIHAQICDGDSYTLPDGSTTQIAGDYGPYAFVSQMGCDSLVEVHLAVIGEIVNEIEADFCEGNAYILPDGSTTVIGGYFGPYHLTSTVGCDSTVFVVLEMLPVAETTVDVEMCDGQQYVLPDGSIATGSGQFGPFALPGANGCDSLVTVIITTMNATTTYLNVENCIGTPYILPDGSSTTESGVFGPFAFEGSNGCDSLVFVDITGLDVIEVNINDQFCENGEYVLPDGSIAYSGGTYGPFSFTSVNGCDSLVMVALSTVPSVEEEVFAQFCEGGSYTLPDGVVVYNSGIYGPYIFLSELGCDSIVMFEIEMVAEITTFLSAEICEGESYTLPDGSETTTGGSYGPFTFMSSGGCDSVVYVSIDFLNYIEVERTDVFCSGSSFPLPDGTSAITDGTYGPFIIPAFEGCDTSLTIILNLLPSVTINLDTLLCNGGSLVINGTVYDRDNPTGTEIIPAQAEEECDTTLLINLSFEACCQPDTIFNALSICAGDAVDFFGDSLDETGIYTHVVTDGVDEGCDLVYVLDLEVSANITRKLKEDICEGESYWFAGQNYTESGIYTELIAGGSVFGCDSITELELTVHPLPVVEAGASKNITCGEPVVLLEGSASGGQPTWTGPGINLINQHLLNPNVSRPGKYFLMVESLEGCIVRDSVIVTIDDDTPSALAGPHQMLTCEVRSVRLQPEILGTNLKISWEGPGINLGNAGDVNPLVTEPGIYILHVTDTTSFCAASPDTTEVVDMAYDVVAKIDGPNTITCETQSIMLEASGSTSGQHVVYVWQNGTGVPLATGQSFLATKAGSYTLIVRDTLVGCEGQATVVVSNDDDYPEIIPANAGNLDCETEEVEVAITIGGNISSYQVQWTGPNGIISSDPDQLTIMVDEEGWYKIQVTNLDNGCVVVDSIRVDDISDLPEVNAVVDHHINCHHPMAQLRSVQSGTSNDIMHMWYDEDGNMVDIGEMVYVDKPGMYYLHVMNMLNNCSDIDSVMVTITAPPQAVLDVQDEHCAEEADGHIVVMDVEGGTGPFQYELVGYGMQSTPDFFDLKPDTYIIRVYDSELCKWEDTVTVEKGLDVKVDIGADIVLRPGEKIEVSGNVNLPSAMVDSVSWTPAELVSCSNCLTTTITGTMSGLVGITILVDGCDASDWLQLSINRDYKVYAPDVFSPNHDGVNDYFILFGDETLDLIEELQVFDRWGNTVFSRKEIQPEDLRAGWDGTFKGKELNPGVYVYRALLRFVDGTEQNYSGNVTLVR